MALPTAQLGQLPGMYAPNAIPVQVVNKNKLWQEALLQFLGKTASDVAGAGVTNAMSRDYADQYGKTPASFLDRLTQGPVVGERQALELNREASAKDLAKMAEEGANTRNTRSTTSAEGIASGEREVQRERIRSEEGRAGNTLAAEYARLGSETGIHQMDNTARINLDRIAADRAVQLEQAKLDAEKDYRSASAGHLKSQTKGQDITNQLLERAVGGGTATGAPGKPTPGLAAYATGTGIPQSATAAPQSAGPDDTVMVQQLLQSGLSPDEVISKLQEVKARQTGVQNMAGSMGQWDAEAARQRQLQVQQILQKLNPQGDQGPNFNYPTY